MFFQYDQQLLHRIISHPIINNTRFFIVITDSIRFFVGLLILWLLYQAYADYKNYNRQLIFMIASLAISQILTQILKFTIQRVRPYNTNPTIQQLVVAHTSSFPSGHATSAFALATAICLLTSRRYLHLGIIIRAILVAYSRMILGVHYPSDIIVGSIIGIVSVFILFHKTNILKIY